MATGSVSGTPVPQHFPLLAECFPPATRLLRRERDSVLVTSKPPMVDPTAAITSAGHPLKIHNGPPDVGF
jgi:hypothetical protein